MRRATLTELLILLRAVNFYPRSPCGERQCTPWNSPVLCYFYPRSPCGERLGRVVVGLPMWNFYPRSPCGERRLNLPSKPIDKNISIHALLAESDKLMPSIKSCLGTFLSTLSLRRATPPCATSSNGREYFYPRSPCGERQYVYVWFTIFVRFLSTLSLRRATPKQSIHHKSVQYFYPRSPCGERPEGLDNKPTPRAISIHALLAESDGCAQYCIRVPEISIHALLAESDKVSDCTEPQFTNFYPRSPCGERRAESQEYFRLWAISIHALLAESDKAKN